MAKDSFSKREKILIIIGDNNFAKKIKDSLSKDGYNISLVQSGENILEGIKKTMPDLIILGITLSESDGYDILAKKQTDQNIAKIPLFLLSTQGLPINMQKVPQNSVAEFIVTFESNPSEVVDKVNKYFNRIVPTDSAKSSMARKKILWIEDDKLIGSILSKKLTTSGFDLLHAKNCEEAMETLTNGVPDAVVVDLLLPGMSGFDIIQKMKMDDKLKNVPVMILSNMNKPSDIEMAKTLGVQKYLVKAAYSLDQIVSEIKGLCYNPPHYVGSQNNR